MFASRWSTQKGDASNLVKSLLADGQEKSLETMLEAIRASGVTGKNALKALYAELESGTIVMTGNWKNGTFRKANQ